MENYEWFKDYEPDTDSDRGQAVATAPESDYEWFGEDAPAKDLQVDPKQIRQYSQQVFTDQAIPLPDGRLAPPSHYDRMQAARGIAKLPELDADDPNMKAAHAASELMRASVVTRETWMMKMGWEAKKAADAIAAGDTSQDNYVTVAAFLEEEEKLAEQYGRMSLATKFIEGLAQTLEFASGIASGNIVAGGVRGAATKGAPGLARRAAAEAAAETARLASSPQLMNIAAQETVGKMAPLGMDMAGIAEGDPFMEALGKSVPKQLISQVVERAGGGLSRLKDAIAKKAGREVGSIRSAIEWDGFVAEFFEERGEDVAQGTFDWLVGDGADFGTTGDILSGDPERMAQGGEDLLVEAAVIGTIGAPGRVSDAMRGRARAKRLAHLKRIRKPGYIPKAVADEAGIEGATRGERLANTDKEIEELEEEQRALADPGVGVNDPPLIEEESPNEGQVEVQEVVPDDAGQTEVQGQGEVQTEAEVPDVDPLSQYLSTQPEGQLDAMAEILVDAAEEGTFSTFFNAEAGQPDEADLNKIRAYEQLAQEMGYTFGDMQVFPDSETVQIPITDAQAEAPVETAPEAEVTTILGTDPRIEQGEDDGLFYPSYTQPSGMPASSVMGFQTWEEAQDWLNRKPRAKDPDAFRTSQTPPTEAPVETAGVDSGQVVPSDSPWSQAETGKPFEATGYRFGEPGESGKFYSEQPEPSLYANRERADELKEESVVLENPLVVDGFVPQDTLLEQWAEEGEVGAANLLGEEELSVKDAYIAKKAKERGHDGLVYRGDTGQGGNEVVDLRKPAPPTEVTPPPVEKSRGRKDQTTPVEPASTPLDPAEFKPGDRLYVAGEGMKGGSQEVTVAEVELLPSGKWHVRYQSPEIAGGRPFAVPLEDIRREPPGTTKPPVTPPPVVPTEPLTEYEQWRQGMEEDAAIQRNWAQEIIDGYEREGIPPTERAQKNIDEHLRQAEKIEQAIIDEGPSHGAPKAEVTPPPVVPKAKPDTPWQAETRKKLAAVPAFKDAEVTVDEEAGTASVVRADGRSTTVHFNADEDLDRIAKKQSRNAKSVHGAYVFSGKEGEFEGGHIYLRSDAGHRTLNHEVVHWLEDEGVITQEEVAKHGGREGIAEKYAKWAAAKQRRKDTVFQRIYDVLEPIFSSQARLFEDIGKRGTETTTKPAPKPKSTEKKPEKAVSRGELEEDANEFIAALFSGNVNAGDDEEAWQMYRRNVGADTRGTPVIDEESFKSNYGTFAAAHQKAKPAAKPKSTEKKPATGAAEKKVTDFRRTTPSEDSLERTIWQDAMQSARDKELKLRANKKPLEDKLKGLRRNATKKRRELEGQIRSLDQQIAEELKTFNIYQSRLREAEVEDILESGPASEVHRESALEELAKIRAERGDESQRKLQSQHEHNVQAAFLQEAQKHEDLLNKDEIQGVAEHARRDFFASSRSTVESLVEKERDRMISARPKTLKGTSSPHLSDKEVKGFNDRMAEATKHRDWHARQEEITREAEVANKAAGEVVKEKFAKEAEVKAKAAEEAEIELVKGRRAGAREAQLESRYWKELRKRATKGKKGKANEVEKSGKTVEVPALILDEKWAVTKAKDEDGTDVFSLTHRPSGMAMSHYGKETEARQLHAFMLEVGVPLEAIEDDGNMPSKVASEGGKAVKAFDNDDLSALTDEQRSLAIEQVKIPDAGIEADLILDSYGLGVHGGVGLKDNSRYIKEMAKEVPEFAYDPIFTVNDKKQLVYRDGHVFVFESSVFNIAPGELQVGQTVGINLPDLGIKRKSQQDVIASVLSSKGFSKVSRAAKGKAVLGTFKGVRVEVRDIGTEESPQWTVAKGKGLAAEEANRAVQAIRWKQPGEEGGTSEPPVEGSAAEEAQRQADESRGEGEARGFFGGGRTSTERVRDDDIPDALKAPDKQERRLQKARGMRRPSLLQKIKQIAEHLKNVTRAQEFIPDTKAFGPANEFFRLLRNVSAMAQDESIRTVAAITDPLGPKQLLLFERFTIMENLSASLELGQPLRFGFETAEEVESYRAKLDDLVSKVPPVAEAIETRRKIVKELADKLVEYDLLPESAKENTETYYHQQVHFYMMAHGATGAGQQAGKVKRSFQKSRVEGEELADEMMDYNTSYLEAEVSWMTDATMEIEKERLFQDLMAKYDRKPELKAKAKRQNFENVVGGPEVVNRIEIILGELAESRASEDSQDSAERARRKQLIEELLEIDPTHPYRQQIAKMAGWVRKEHGLEYSEEFEEDGDFWALIHMLADQSDIPALSFLAAVNEREDFIRDTLGDDYATWMSLADEMDDVSVFQPEPGNHFFRAFTIPDRLVEQLQSEVIDTAELSKEDLKQVLALGGPRRQFVVPPEIAAQLEQTRKGEAAHGLALLADEMMRTWKVYTLLNPKRAVSYNLRNITGDIDPLVAADPRLLKFTDRAMRELSGYHKGRLQLTPELRLARDLGVIGSGFVAEEVPDVKDLAIFRRFISESGKATLPVRPVKAYMDIVKPLSQFREDTLRYAAFLGYREQLRQGKLKHYGGSKKEVVQSLKKEMGVDVAAAHLARELLGDYGNISVAGNWIRQRLMPFWSFQEINIRRVPRLLANAYDAGGTWRTAGTLSAAAGRTILTSRIAWMFAGLWVWNNLIQGGDEEEELTGQDRARPHVILGRNPDGSTRIFRRVGALGDFLEWFGISEAIAMIGKRRAGQVDTSDIIKEMAFATPEKVINSLRPDIKALYELPTGTSLFPDPFHPRSVRRGEAATQIFGLTDEYKWLKGKVLADGSTVRPHYWQRWMFGISDPRHAALSVAYERRADFLKKKGRERAGIFPVSKYKEARDAAKFEDYGAFVDWKRKYVEERGEKAPSDFKDWLGSIDPISGSLGPEDELEFETDFLTNEQRQQLAVARNYAHELRDLLVVWWDTDDKSEVMKTQVGQAALRKLDTKEPMDSPGNVEALRDIKSMAPTHQEAQQLLVDSYRKTDSKGKKQTEWQGQGRKALDPSYRAKAKALAEFYGEGHEGYVKFRKSL